VIGGLPKENLSGLLIPVSNFFFSVNTLRQLNSSPNVLCAVSSDIKLPKFLIGSVVPLTVNQSKLVIYYLPLTYAHYLYLFHTNLTNH